MAQKRSDRNKQCIKEWKERNPEKMAEYRKKERERTSFVDKIAAFAAYGGPICCCCGEQRLSFLTLDHTNNDGSKHRDKVGSGAMFYRWLKKNNYPQEPLLQVLCANCNQSKQINNGVCEHHIERGNATEKDYLWVDGRKKINIIPQLPTGGKQ